LTVLLDELRQLGSADARPIVDGIAAEAHGVRGAASTVALEALAALAAELEQLAERWRPDEPDLDAELARVATHLRDVVRAVHVLDGEEGGGEIVSRPPEGDGPIVLHVEDNHSNLRLIERVLAHRPEIRLAEARTGAAGIALAAELAPDLILLDLGLPDIPGEDVLRLVRQASTMRDVPVVVISAEARPAESDRLLAAGADDFIVKPIDVATLLTVIDRLLARARR
jgi:CheY-like chemotaxis protein